MNAKSKIAIWIGIALLVGTGMYPPWRMIYIQDPHVELPVGWHRLDSPPESTAGTARIDLVRLGIEWAAALVITAGLFFAWPFASLSPGAVTRVKAGTEMALGIAAFVLWLAVLAFVAQSAGSWLEAAKQWMRSGNH